MRVVLQRVKRGAVHVNGEEISNIGRGVVVLVGICESDTEADVQWAVHRILGAKLWENSEGKSWRKSVGLLQYDILLVSQFTLYCSMNKKHQPDFRKAMAPAPARGLYDLLVKTVTDAHAAKAVAEYGAGGRAGCVREGCFGAKMDVELVNDGPVTLLIESPQKNVAKGAVASSSNTSQKPPTSSATLSSTAAESTKILQKDTTVSNTADKIPSIDGSVEVPETVGKEGKAISAAPAVVVRDAATNTESCEDTALSSLSNLCEISSVTNAVAAIEKVVETTPYKPPELLSISTVASPASTAAPQATAPAVPPAASCSAKDVSETVVALDGFVRTTVNAANRLPDVIQSTSTSNVEDGYTTDKALLRTDWQLPEAQKEPGDSNLVDDEEYIDDFEDEEDENTTIDMREERDQRRKTNKVELHRTCVVETMQESRVHRSTFAKEKERNITRNDKEAESNVYMQVAFQQNGDAIGEAAASDGYAADGGFSFFKRRAEALIRSATAAAAAADAAAEEIAKAVDSTSSVALKMPWPSSEDEATLPIGHLVQVLSTSKERIERAKARAAAAAAAATRGHTTDEVAAIAASAGSARGEMQQLKHPARRRRVADFLAALVDDDGNIKEDGNDEDDDRLEVGKHGDERDPCEPELITEKFETMPTPHKESKDSSDTTSATAAMMPLLEPEGITPKSVSRSDNPLSDSTMMQTTMRVETPVVSLINRERKTAPVDPSSHLSSMTALQREDEETQIGTNCIQRGEPINYESALQSAHSPTPPPLDNSLPQSSTADENLRNDKEFHPQQSTLSLNITPVEHAAQIDIRTTRVALAKGESQRKNAIVARRSVPLSSETHAVLLVVDDDPITVAETERSREFARFSEGKLQHPSHGKNSPRFMATFRNSRSAADPPSFGNPYLAATSLRVDKRGKNDATEYTHEAQRRAQGDWRAAVMTMTSLSSLSNITSVQVKASARATALEQHASAASTAALKSVPCHYTVVPRERLREVFRSESLLRAFTALEHDATRACPRGKPRNFPFYRVRRREVPLDIPVVPFIP